MDDFWQPDNHVLYGISSRMHQDYLKHFYQLDPLHPDKFRGDDLRLVRMAPDMKQQSQEFYNDFMRPNNITDMAEIFIRRKNKIIAGISVLRDAPFNNKKLCGLTRFYLLLN